MQSQTPRIAKVAVSGDTQLIVSWVDGRSDRVDLCGWIATGGDLLAPLSVPSIFRRAAVGDYGASVLWKCEDDELAIDAVHLQKLAEE